MDKQALAVELRDAIHAYRRYDDAGDEVNRARAHARMQAIHDAIKAASPRSPR